MRSQKKYQAALNAMVKPSEKKVKDRQSVLNEIKSFGEALSAVIGNVKKRVVSALIQDIPPLPNGVGALDEECNGYMLILVVHHNERPEDVIINDVRVTVLSCWFSAGSCYPCEIRANNKVYECNNKTKVINSLLDVSKSCLVPILTEFEDAVRISEDKKTGPGIELMDIGGPTGNVNPADGEPSSSDFR